ncbi:hypothetical protein NYR55_01530 [Sphingomonas sp. BGYR3]|uniref:hypothetical protein n=1 Tax=Sphingomonas sp. BGYR3 TaxID=2975483 RepID=UPI0021A8FE68|nr:hypothetical protein [Sphingomonas sp. BGYR3]MDG5487309.1 hypothetical protein [Sphingomonas sp. BGYR3]
MRNEGRALNLLLLLTALLTGLSGTMAAGQPIGHAAIEARQQTVISVVAEVAQAVTSRPWLALIGGPVPALTLDGAGVMLGDQRALLRGERRLI